MSVETGKLFVGGIHASVAKDEFRQYFEEFGDISDCVLMFDPETKKSRGFGFVTFKDPESATKVLTNAPHSMNGKTMDCKASVRREDAPPSKRPKLNDAKKVFVGGIAQGTTKEGLKKFFNNINNFVTDVAMMLDVDTQKSRGFAFVTFAEEDAVERVCNTRFFNIDGKTVECKKAERRGDPATGDMQAVGANNTGYQGWNQDQGYNQNTQYNQGGNFQSPPNQQYGQNRQNAQGNYGGAQFNSGNQGAYPQQQSPQQQQQQPYSSGGYQQQQGTPQGNYGQQQQPNYNYQQPAQQQNQALPQQQYNQQQPQQQPPANQSYSSGAYTPGRAAAPANASLGNYPQEASGYGPQRGGNYNQQSPGTFNQPQGGNYNNASGGYQQPQQQQQPPPQQQQTAQQQQQVQQSPQNYENRGQNNATNANFHPYRR